MEERNKLEARIFGNDYVLRSARPDHEMRSVVNFVQQKISEAASAQTRYNKTMQVTLACINLADEYFQLRANKEEIQAALDQQKQESRQLTEELEDLRAQLLRATQAATERESKLAALRKAMEENENRRLELAKQFQEYQRTHR